MSERPGLPEDDIDLWRGVAHQERGGREKAVDRPRVGCVLKLANALRFTVLVLAGCITGLLLVSAAKAEPFEVCWQNATTNTDQTPIPSSGNLALASTEIEAGACFNGQPQDPRTSLGSVTADDVCFDAVIHTPGEWCLVAQHTNNDGAKSDDSNVAVKVIAARPEPPVDLEQTTLLAYVLLERRDLMLFVRVGTVPAEAECHADQYVSGYMGVLETVPSLLYLVAWDAVVWDAEVTVRRDAVYTICG